MMRSERAETSQEQLSAAAVATARMPGIDVARALAILGMVLVNYKAKMEAATQGPDWLVWLSSLIDGRAAILFVVLAGVGVSLRSHRAREHRERLPFERVSLLKRAAVLFGAGLLHLHMWEWDILHFYGIYLALAACLLNVSGYVLWFLAVGCVYTAVVLQTYFNFSTEASLFSPYGMIIHLFCDGMHPVFPWMAFLLVGMWLGSQNLRHRGTRRRILMAALGVIGSGVIWNALDPDVLHMFALKASSGLSIIDIVLSPPIVHFFLDIALAITAICLCISCTERCAEHRSVQALVATGQLAFTLYIAHAVAILIPHQHDLLMETSLAVSIGYSLLFYLVSVTLCVWWRRRWPYGPLEGLIRQITGRTASAPWGGERLP